MGIKYESDTPFKRVLEELGAAGLFGGLWMTISTIGQSAVESGFIKESVKHFYEIGLAVLAHKAIKLGQKAPTAVEVGEISKSLIEAEIDVSKIQAGSSSEILRAQGEVSKFLDIRELRPKESVIIFLEETRIPPTQASQVYGWKVGEAINNRTLLGDVPKWSIVRYRYWKNEAFQHRRGVVKEKLKYEVNKENISRMKRGLAPQFFNEEMRRMESVELHHQPPQRDGGLFDFIELTSEEHAVMDKFKHIKKISENLKGK